MSGARRGTKVLSRLGIGLTARHMPLDPSPAWTRTPPRTPRIMAQEKGNE